MLNALKSKPLQPIGNTYKFKLGFALHPFKMSVAVPRTINAKVSSILAFLRFVKTEANVVVNIFFICM